MKIKAGKSLSVVKNTRERLRRNLRRYAAKMAAEAGISQISMRRILKEDLRTYPYKMQKTHELSTTHKRLKLDRRQHILNLMKDGSVSNLVLTDEKKFDVEQCLNHQNDRVWSRDGSVDGRRVGRSQNPVYAMMWAAITATGRSPLVFVPSIVKLSSQGYISDILKAELLPWTRKHFDGAPWTLQRDSAPSHGSKMTQSWILTQIPAFISKDEWPSRSKNLNPLDFSVWSILVGKVCRTPHDSMDNLKLELQREWALIPQEVLRASCEAFQSRLKSVIKNKGAILNKCF